MVTFFGKCDIEILEEKLKDIKYDEEDVKKALQDTNISDYLGNVTKEEFLCCLFN